VVVELLLDVLCIREDLCDCLVVRGAFQRVPDGAEFFLPAEEGGSLDLDQAFSSSCGPFSSLRSGLYFRDDCRNQCFQRVWFLLGGLVVTALLPSILLHSSFLAITTRLRAVVAR
jgi:hypothetical protein